MAPARGPAAAAAASLLVLAVVLLASPGAQASGSGEECMDLCVTECLKNSAEEVEQSKKLNATQCQDACNVGCPIAYPGQPEDVKAPPAAKSGAPAAGRNGRNVPAHYVCVLIHIVFGTLWY